MRTPPGVDPPLVPKPVPTYVDEIKSMEVNFSFFHTVLAKLSNSLCTYFLMLNMISRKKDTYVHTKASATMFISRKNSDSQSILLFKSDNLNTRVRHCSFHPNLLIFHPIDLWDYT